MKKNITINLFGQLYAIDEDACNLLEQYLENMKSYFAKREGGDEIADDIEHRIAEIFAELKAQGTEAVSIEHVQSIIHRIGNPEQMEADSDEEETTTANNKPNSNEETPEMADHQADSAERRSWFAQRRLYRDTQDKMLGGVMSGLSKYFGTNDPLPWRIAMVMLAFFSFSTMGIIYLIAWMLIPEATTAEQRLKMQGKPINASTLSEEVMQSANKSAQYLGSPEFQSKARGCLGTLLSILVFCLKLCVLFFCGMGVLVLLAYTALLAFGTFGNAALLVSSGMFDSDFITALQQHAGAVWMLWGIAVSTLICGSIIIYAIVRSLIARPDSKRLSTGTCITLTIIALLSAATAITLTVFASYTLRQATEEIDRQENTRDGYYMGARSRERLDEGGWSVIAFENGNDDGCPYKKHIDFLRASLSVPCFDFRKGEDDEPMRIQFERTTDVDAGWYHLEAIGFAKGLGAYVYARTDSNLVASVELPVDEANGLGNMSRMSLDEMKHINLFSGQLTDTLYERYTRNAVKGWSFVRSEKFYCGNGSVTLGTTNIPSVTGQISRGEQLRHFGLYDLRLVPDSVPLQTASTALPTAKHTSKQG